MITLLADPLLAGTLALLGGAVMLDSPTVYVDTLSIPEPMVQQGFTSEAVQRRIADAMLELERQAVTRPEARRMAVEAQQDALETLTDYFDVTELLRGLQDASGLIQFVVDGDVFVEQGRLRLHLQVRQRTGQTVEATLERPLDQMPALLADTAREIMLVTEPQILCAALLRRSLEGTGGRLEVRQCIDAALGHDLRPKDRVWLHNLDAVALFLDGDQAGALTQLRRALRADPDFSPALLNVGVLYALNGRHEDAVKAFAQVFRKPSQGESPQTYAVTYVEWARSLVALGRRQEALELLPMAVRADPRYADGYLLWAELVGPGAQARALRRAGLRVAGESEQTFTENLVGHIRDQGRAHMARGDELPVS